MKGFYFYYHIIRKDLVNKYHIFASKFIPKFNRISLSVQTNQKDVVLSDSHLFSWVLLLEFLTNFPCKKTACNIVNLDHFTTLTNYRLFVNLVNFTCIYEIFLFIFFVWFRGLVYTIQHFPVPAGRIVKDRFKRRLDKITIEYLKYNKPQFFRETVVKKNKRKLNARSTAVKSTIWMDFTFCKFIPISITNACVSLALNLQFFFNIKLGAEQKKVMLSCFKLFHRFKELKQYQVK